MSYINVHKFVSESSDRDRFRIPEFDPSWTEDVYDDGEDLAAVQKILALLDTLDDGEAIVITVDNF